MPIFTRTWRQILREVDSTIDRGSIFRMLVNRYRLLGRQNLLAVYLFPWCSNFHILVLFNIDINFLDLHQVLRMRARLLAHVTIEHLKFTLCLFASFLSLNLHGFIKNNMVTIKLFLQRFIFNLERTDVFINVQNWLIHVL